MLNLEKDNILLSRFRLREKIGQGGMGQVWLVWDQELEIQIAAKILNPQLMSDPHRVQLLKNECRNTRRLAHPNIVRVFDFHRSEDLVFISMEYVDGQNLNDYRRQQEAIGTLQIIRLIKPVINALGYAHEMGLVHRDIKAGNILIDQQQAPRLTDFGIAGVFKSGPQALEITSGGSLFCMSPQQLENHRPTPSDDMYALGVLLYQMITGYPPFYPDITRDRIRHEPPVPVNQRLGQLAAEALIPDSMETLIASMLAKAPAGRPGSMQEIEAFFDRMLQAGNEPTLPPHSPATEVIKKPPASDQTEMIAPVSVTPSKKRKRLPLNRHSNLIKGVTLLAAFIILLGGGLWLFRYLASQNSKPGVITPPVSKQNQSAPEKPAAASERTPPTPSDPTRLAAEKMEAEKKLSEFMQLKQVLEAKGVSKWGAETYDAMSQLADEADRLFIEKQFASATDRYTAAVAKAQELVDQIEPVLKRLLAEGQAAIEDGNGPLAEEKFSIALLIDPDNPDTRDSLQRAKNTEAVKRLLASGNHHETEGNLRAAHSDYQEAMRLDPASNEARQALARVDGQLRDQQYRQLMSDG
ncbi:MAG: protein kinase, partial [Desulfobacterales bacterium]